MRNRQNAVSDIILIKTISFIYVAQTIQKLLFRLIIVRLKYTSQPALLHVNNVTQMILETSGAKGFIFIVGARRQHIVIANILLIAINVLGFCVT